MTHLRDRPDLTDPDPDMVSGVPTGVRNGEPRALRTLTVRQRKQNTTQNGGVTGRPETMCPSTNVLGPLVPNFIIPCDTKSLD